MLYNTFNMTREKLTEILEALRAGVAELMGDRLEAVYLYGSQARGDTRPDSDIDVLVVIRGDFDYFDLIEKTGLLVSILSLDNDTVIALAFVSKENYDKRQIPFLMNIRREGVLV